VCSESGSLILQESVIIYSVIRHPTYFSSERDIPCILDHSLAREIGAVACAAVLDQANVTKINSVLVHMKSEYRYDAQWSFDFLACESEEDREKLLATGAELAKQWRSYLYS